MSRRVLLALLLLTGASPAFADAHVYSPFAVLTPGISVSFKDVGLKVEPAERAAILEAIAAGVAASLAAEEVHRPEWALPGWHRQCRGAHVYVDLWRSAGPDRLGFSLWQGCSADDRLAHVELPTVTSAFEVGDALARAGNFGEAIGDAIRSCTARPGC